MAKPYPWLEPAVWTGGALPGAVLALQAVQGGLGANPVSSALNRLGALALIFLVLTLACRPLKLVLGWNWPMRLKRALGLIAFGYASLHLGVYLFDHGALAPLLDDVLKRPFVTVGFAAWVLLVPLALTSTDASVRRLGFVRWQRLHRLAYACAALGVVHFLWRVKKDATEPLLYAAVLAVLLVVRVAKAKPKTAAKRG